MGFKSGDADSPSAAPIIGADKVVITDGSGLIIGDPLVTPTELETLDGVTSNVQTQLNGKQPVGNYITALTGDVVANGPGSVSATIQSNAVTNSKIINGAIDDSKVAAAAGVAVNKLAAMTINRAVISDASGFIAPSVTTATELSYVSGVTSSIQTQLNSTLVNPMTTNGDLITQIAGVISRLGIGTTGQFLRVVSGLPAWGSPRTLGEFKWSFNTTPPEGYLSAMNLTLGLGFNSGLYFDLYSLIWNFTTLPGAASLETFTISSPRGVSAAADWALNKNIFVKFQSTEVFLRSRAGANAGEYQTDAFQGHRHQNLVGNGSDSGSGNPRGLQPNASYFTNSGDPVTDGTNGTPRTANETRPKNVAAIAYIGWVP